MKIINVLDVENNVNFTFENTKEDGGLINGVEGFEYPQTKVVVEDIAAKGGAKAVTSAFGRRICSFVYRITCDVLETRRELLAAMRQTGFLKLVTFTTLDDLDLQFYAYVNKVLSPYTSMTTPILVEFSAPDWRFFSQTLHTDSIDDADSEILVNAGNEITDPILRIYGPFSGTSITNLSNGQQLELTETVADGDYVEINTTDHTLFLNGDENDPVYSYLDPASDWISLNPGNNEIMMSSMSPGANTHLEVDWRDAYNGI